jgi:hypothetical protein
MSFCQSGQPFRSVLIIALHSKMVLQGQAVHGHGLGIEFG